MDKLTAYQNPSEVLPGQNRLWPLYGAGLENLGKNGLPIEVTMPHPAADELLVRHDACGLCFSDIKVIKTGQEHPRIQRDMHLEPVVLGHEVTLTVVEVGENLRQHYHPGDRFIIQADIFVKSVGYAYGYAIQGGLSQYNILDQRVLNGDHGNYLIPVKSDTGYAESALTEPWACVTAAYELKYRTGLKSGGCAWIIGTPQAVGVTYTISAGFDRRSHPARIFLTDVPSDLSSEIHRRAAESGIEVIEDCTISSPPPGEMDDIILLGTDADIVEKASPKLANFGVFAILSDQSFNRRMDIDVGRVHYNRWVYVGSTGTDIARAYSDVPVRSTLRPSGRTWFVGAGGPMGRMHLQRALQVAQPPATILCTDVSDLRLDDLRASFEEEAAQNGIELICLNPTCKEEYQTRLAGFKNAGFDDIVVLAPIPPVISEAAEYLAPNGVMNVFAGLARGSMVNLDMSGTFLNSTRIIGHSASSIEDLRFMLNLAESGQLSPNRSVAAIGSLTAAYAGLQAVLDTSFPGKVVIYPHIQDLPLTPLAELETKLPSVFALLKDGLEWTNAAEAEFLRLMLP